MYVHVRMYECMYVCIYVCMHVCMHVYRYVHVYMPVYAVWSPTETWGPIKIFFTKMTR